MPALDRLLSSQGYGVRRKPDVTLSTTSRVASCTRRSGSFSRRSPALTKPTGGPRTSAGAAGRVRTRLGFLPAEQESVVALVRRVHRVPVEQLRTHSRDPRRCEHGCRLNARSLPLLPGLVVGRHAVRVGREDRGTSDPKLPLPDQFCSRRCQDRLDFGLQLVRDFGGLTKA